MASTHPHWLLAIMLALGLLPILVMCCTCYLKVSIVINLLKSGLGFTSGGTMAIELALSLALVSLIMHPIVVESAGSLEEISPLPLQQAPRFEDIKKIEPAIKPWREFLEKHAGAKEIKAVEQLAAGQQSSETTGSDRAEVSARSEVPPRPLRVLFSAFVLSELRGAIVIGVMVLVPFLLVDLIIANTLAALGLTMVSPVTIALPCKLLLFYACDGWILISRTLLLSY